MKLTGLYPTWLARLRRRDSLLSAVIVTAAAGLLALVAQQLSGWPALVCTLLVLSAVRWLPSMQPAPQPTVHTAAESRSPVHATNVPEASLTRDQLEMVTRAAGVVIWDWDLRSGRLAADSRMAQRLSVSAQEFLANPQEYIRKRIHPEDWPKYQRAFAEAMKQSIPVECSYRVLHDSGAYGHRHLTGTYLRDADGKPVRFLGVAVDNTRLVQAAERLEHQARHMQALVDRYNLATEVAQIGVWDWDVQRKILHSGSSYAESMAANEVQGQQFGVNDFLEKMLHPEDRAHFGRVMREALQSQDRVQTRYRILRNGSIEHMLMHGRIFRDAEGRAQRLLWVNWNVTEQVHAEDRIQQQNEEQRQLLYRLNLATKVGGVGVWDWDLQADRITLDAAMQRMFNSPLPSIEGQVRATILRIVHPAEREQFGSVIDSSLSATEAVTHRLRVQLENGQEHYIQVHASALRNAEGVVQRMLGVVRDITEEVEQAQQLARRREKERTLHDRLNLATETADIGIWDHQLETHTFVANEQFKRIYGWQTEPDEAALIETAHPLDRPRLLQQIAAALEDRSYSSVLPLRYRIVRPDGAVRHVQTHLRIFRDAEGCATRTLGVISDVSDQVRTAELLEKQVQQERLLHERLHMAQQAAGITSWQLEMDTWHFSWVENPSWLFAPHGSDTSSIAIVARRVLKEDHPVFQQAMERALADGSRTLSYRYRARHPDGRVHHLQHHARLFVDEHGRPCRALGLTWDITNEIEAAAQLEGQAQEQRILRERLSIATLSAGISSWEIDLANSKFLWVDNAIRALGGAREDDALNTFRERIHPEDKHLFGAAIGQAAKAGRDLIAYRYRAFDPTGKLAHVQVHAKLYFNSAGRAVRALGVAWDCTIEVESAEEIARQAKQLHDTERRLERASLSSSEGHWEWDLVSGLAWQSSSCHALLGYQEGELPVSLSELVKLLTPVDDMEWRGRLFDDHLEHNVPYEYEGTLVLSNGEVRWFRVRGMAERDDRGRPLRMAGSIQDIHRQKLAENALRLVQRRFERAIAGTQDGLWELEVDGMAWCSPRVGELLGYAAGELASDANFLREFLHPQDGDAIATAAQTHFQTGAPYDVEIRLRTKPSEYRWYRARASAERDTDGRPLRLSGSLQDVTEARGAREALVRASEAAEAANRAKSEFLANVSHEIRTPMNGIIGMTSLLFETPLDQVQRDYAGTIRSSADSLLTVINDILDFSKIEAGKLDIETLQFDLRSTVEEVGTMMAFHAAAKDVELIVDVQQDVPLQVLGDPQRLRQCLVNLASNAIKFTRTGEIVISVQCVGIHPERTLLRFEVRDTGIGIAAQTLATLFQPFVQADSSTTRHFGGTGLGLSIVRRLVEMMHGEVGVSSEVGRGSVFWFTLPLDACSGALPGVDLQRLGRRVLLVDDNHTQRRVLERHLRCAGYDVTNAQEAREVPLLLERACSEQAAFDAVLVDADLVAGAGRTLDAWLGAVARDARVIVLAGLEQRNDLQRFIAMGCAGQLLKPVRTGELLECLDRVVQGRLSPKTPPTLVAQPQEPRRARCRGTVLLTEDNLVNQKVAARFLERLGCTVQIAGDGAQAVQACQREHFDLILMDLQMPVMDGLTATRQIRALPAYVAQPTPIVALTANAMVGQSESCSSAGMNGFLTKPIDAAKLQEVLERFGLGVGEEPVPTTDSVSQAG
jgi:PAS domain S-box-containing protein